MGTFTYRGTQTVGTTKAAPAKLQNAQQENEQLPFLNVEKERTIAIEKQRKQKFKQADILRHELPKIVKAKVDIEHLQNADGNIKTLLSTQQINQVAEWFQNNPNMKKMSRKDEYVDKSGHSFKIPFSVISTKDGALYALYQGKSESRLGTGNYGSVKLIQNLRNGKWSAVKVQKITTETFHRKTELQREGEMLDAVGLLLGQQSITTANYQRMKAGIQSKEYYIIHLYSAKEFEAQIKDFEATIAQAPGNDAILHRILTYSINAALTLYKELNDIHSKGVLHRDLHPGNILVDKQGNSTIIDFGLSVKINSPESKSLVVGREDILRPLAVRASIKEMEYQYTIQDDLYSAMKCVQKFQTAALIKQYADAVNIPKDLAQKAGKQLTSLKSSAQDMIILLTEIQNHVKNATSIEDNCVAINNTLLGLTL